MGTPPDDDGPSPVPPGTTGCTSSCAQPSLVHGRRVDTVSSGTVTSSSAQGLQALPSPGLKANASTLADAVCPGWISTVSMLLVPPM